MQARILCVDDDPVSYQLMSEIIGHEDNKYCLTIAASAGEAILIMKRLRFDLYILDYCLPSISGVDLCRAIRSANPSVPIRFP